MEKNKIKLTTVVRWWIFRRHLNRLLTTLQAAFKSIEQGYLNYSYAPCYYLLFLRSFIHSLIHDKELYVFIIIAIFAGICSFFTLNWILRRKPIQPPYAITCICLNKYCILLNEIKMDEKRHRPLCRKSSPSYWACVNCVIRRNSNFNEWIFVRWWYFIYDRIEMMDVSLSCFIIVVAWFIN